MRIKPLSLFLACILALFSCKDQQEARDISPDATIYHNGEIVTMEGSEAYYAESVVALDGKIVFVGNKEQAIKDFPNAKPFDLKGQTLMPGLIEPHLHPSLAAIMLQNEIIAPYDWKLPSGTKKGVQYQCIIQKGQKEFVLLRPIKQGIKGRCNTERSCRKPLLRIQVDVKPH